MQDAEGTVQEPCCWKREKAKSGSVEAPERKVHRSESGSMAIVPPKRWRFVSGDMINQDVYGSCSPSFQGSRVVQLFNHQFSGANWLLVSGGCTPPT